MTHIGAKQDSMHAAKRLGDNCFARSSRCILRNI